MADRPNILHIFTDQQRWDTIHALGNPVIKTPALDRLAEEGTSFTSAYSPDPVCVPARCSMIYGLYPSHSRCYENGSHMPEDDRQTFMTALAERVALCILKHPICSAYKDHQYDASPKIDVKGFCFNDLTSILKVNVFLNH